jgi:hypothetical protein
MTKTTFELRIGMFRVLPLGPAGPLGQGFGRFEPVP